MPGHENNERYTATDLAEKRALIAEQGVEAFGGRSVRCGGTGIDGTRCAVVRPVVRLYRCYYCGVYFCDACGAAHFDPDAGRMNSK